MFPSIIPKIVNNFIPFFFIKGTTARPNFTDKKATTKNLNPRENRQIKKNIKILKPINPLVIVKTLNGMGVNPARNNSPKKKYEPWPADRLFLSSKTLFS